MSRRRGHRQRAGDSVADCTYGLVLRSAGHRVGGPRRRRGEQPPNPQGSGHAKARHRYPRSLIGHGRGFTLDTYSGGKGLARLQGIVEKIAYPGLGNLRGAGGYKWPRHQVSAAECGGSRRPQTQRDTNPALQQSEHPGWMGQPLGMPSTLRELAGASPGNIMNVPPQNAAEQVAPMPVVH